MLANDVAPIKFRIYKGIKGRFGAAQFTLNQPFFLCNQDRKHRYYIGELVKEANFKSNVKCNREGCNGTLVVKEGNVFLEMTVATGPNKYDWKQKISFCLSVKDIGQLLAAIRTRSTKELTHDPGAGTDRKGTIMKKFTYFVGEDKNKGAILSLYEKKKGDEEGRKVSVPMSLDETIILANLLAAAVPVVLAWG